MAHKVATTNINVDEFRLDSTREGGGKWSEQGKWPIQVVAGRAVSVQAAQLVG